MNLQHYYDYPAATPYALDGSDGHSTSLQDLLDFAKAHGKPFSVPETGAGSSDSGHDIVDNAVFPAWLAGKLQASGVPISYVGIWDSNGGGNYEFSQPGDNKPAEAAAWAKYFGAAPGSPAPSVPGAVLPAVKPAPAAPGVTLVGAGSDTLALSVAEDAWNGDARFTVKVDGKQVGDAQTATALKSVGQSQVFNVMGDFGPGAHTATVTFLNDAYGGTPTTDRNLYVTGASYDGVQVPGAAATLLSNGGVDFAIPAKNVGSDTLSVMVSEDAWKADALASISIDGKTLSSSSVVTASHGKGESQTLTFHGSWGPGPHTVGVSFLNDAYGGTASTDRNLYVDGVTYNGAQVAGAKATLYSNSGTSFTTPAPTTPATITVKLAEDAWKGDAQYAILVDGKQIGSSGVVTASNSLGKNQEVTLNTVLTAGKHDLGVSFLNDAYGGTTATDRNLYVKSVEVNGTAVPGSATSLYSTGTAHFPVVVQAA